MVKRSNKYKSLTLILTVQDGCHLKLEYVSLFYPYLKPKDRLLSLESLDSIIKSGTKLTPMMQQYYELKKQVPDLILLFRMGDFYEVFFEDAKKTARLLNITLTHRGKLGEFPIPMAGIPHHAANSYIDRLTSLGERVAICEQIEDPKEAKGIVKRGITQIASPGMPFDLEKADSKKNHYMLAGAYNPKDSSFSLVAIDYTTGDFFGSLYRQQEQFLEAIISLGPSEWITWLGQWDEFPVLAERLKEIGSVTTHLSQEYFQIKHTQHYLEKLIPAFSRDKTLEQNPAVLSPLGAMSFYICSTQDSDSYQHLKPFYLQSDSEWLRASKATLQGLEILPRHRDLYDSSLLGFFDHSQTALGSRFLRQVFQKPLLKLSSINERQNFIAALMKSPQTLDQIRNELQPVRDIERILAKMATGKVTASDLLQIATSARVLDSLKDLLKKIPTQALPVLKAKILLDLQQYASQIELTLNDELGASLEKGNLIKSGFNKERDKLAKLAHHAADELLQLEESYKKKTGISKLRIKNNNVNGYFIEVSKGQTDKVPKWFHRRQTLTNCERYTTEDLSSFEKEIVLAQTKLEKMERELFKNLIAKGLNLALAIQKLAHYLANVDAFSCLAFVALQENFSRPKLEEKKKILHLEGAWHPLIKATLTDHFIAHNLRLDEKVFFGLITGPNMAGKTTVMREVAIIQHLAQIGSFVPAKMAHLSLADYLFSRLGASDDILRGQSTFMVEMTETAEILRHATDRSLIILDEVGRGTSTYDGLAIAWSLVEHLVTKTRARALFATHYHELIQVAEQLEAAKNMTVETINKDGKVEFLYNLVERPASQSFGLYVAKLAGLPKSVLARAQTIHESLETEQNTENHHQDSLHLFGNQLSFLPQEPQAPVWPKPIRGLIHDLQDLDITTTTPLDALIKLQSIKNNLDEITKQ
jgi:DNA mismatch repair protein MutS